MRYVINPFTHRFDVFEQDIPGSSDIETLTGDVGGSVSPDGLANLNILGGPGIDVTGNPLTNTLTIRFNGGTEGTGQTVGAVALDLVSIPMGATPGVYLVTADVVGFDAITPLGVAYFATGCVRTTGVVGVEIGQEITDDYEEGPMAACNIVVVAVGNNMVVRVTGLAGKTIDWTGIVYYTFRG